MADAVRSGLSLSWELLQEFGVLPSSNPLSPVLPIFLVLLHMIREPGSSWVLDIESFAFEGFHLLDFLSRRHRSLQVGIRVELVGLQMALEDQRCPVDHLEGPSKILHSFDCVGRRIGDFQIDGNFESLELIATLGEQLDAVCDLAKNPSVDQSLQSDRLLGVQVSLLDVVGQLSEIELSQILISVEPILSETKLRETTHHVALAAFKAPSNGATGPRVLPLVALSSSLSKAASRSPTDSFLCLLGPWVVPQIVGSKGQECLRVHLLSIQTVKCCKHAELLGDEHWAGRA